MIAVPRHAQVPVSVTGLLCILAVCACLAGCTGNSGTATTPPKVSVDPSAQAATPPPSAVKPSPIRFESAGSAAGIDFKIGHNGKSPLTILETSGGGCAFFDYDSDTWPDILLVGPHNARVYHNERNGQFKDVSATSGIEPNRYWMGCAAGDYDSDGKPDIFLTGYGYFALYHNEGAGRFRDVTAGSGIGGLSWSLSGAFADFNSDGKLDLYVSQYVKFDETTDQICQVGSAKSACGPEMYDPLSGKLFLNAGGGKFKAVPWKDSGKTWGALASDLLGQGHPSLYLANDMVQGDLWSLQGGQWKNIGPSSGTSFDAQGHVQGGMGVESGDYDNDGKLDLVVTTYFAQPTALYHNDGSGLFTEMSSPTLLGHPTMPYVGFGAALADFDCDGWLDLIIANGHVRDNVPQVDSGQTYAQPILTLRNTQGKFEDVSAGSGLGSLRLVGRGLSAADYDRDGRPDVLVVDLEGSALLLRNVSDKAHWLEVGLSQPAGTRDGSGAMLTLEARGTRQIREIRTCGSVLSSQMPVAHFGLGEFGGPCKLTVRWQRGKTQTVSVPKVDKAIIVRRADGSLP